uniref:Uncharacterized protein n=1 Tax=Candidatus Kentrum sp. MB TaxID=2138164 RepID=A0A450XI41_9GAMM|nr:MAG: hypothetical protein BECKMB1821G_GA0114241_10441 [Candidatus Kentron sp. MB]
MGYRKHGPLHDQCYVGAGHARDKFFDCFVEDFLDKGLETIPTSIPFASVALTIPPSSFHFTFFLALRQAMDTKQGELIPLRQRGWNGVSLPLTH